MIAGLGRPSAAIGALTVFLAFAGGQAQGAQTWQLHTTLEGKETPFLCQDPETAGLIIAVLGRAIAARADAEKAKRLFEIAAKLEAEICARPAADDVVILRCTLDHKKFGDSHISLVKLSALLRSNPSAGEQPFYAWTYATIEPSKDSGPSAEEANKRWCTEETVADAPLEPTPDLVLRVQQRFFDFGFNIPRIDGRLTPETVQGLIDFQRWAGLPPTGQLTRLTVEKIDATEAPSPWVALAFDGYGKYSMVTGATRRAAEGDAVSGLRRKSRSDYRVASVPYPNCMAFATVRYKRRRRTYTQAFSSAGDSKAAAKQNALNYCGREKSGGTCRFRDAVCAAGKDQPVPRYDPKSIPAHTAPPSADDGSRFDPKDIPINAPAPGKGAGPRFDPKNMPLNSMAPELSSQPAGGADDPKPEAAGDKSKR